jgi:hypothetical protein
MTNEENPEEERRAEGASSCFSLPKLQAPVTTPQALIIDHIFRSNFAYFALRRPAHERPRAAGHAM